MSNATSALLTIPELATVLYGPDATVGQRKLLYRLCAEGKIRHVRLGRKVMVPSSVPAELMAEA